LALAEQDEEKAFQVVDMNGSKRGVSNWRTDFTSPPPPNSTPSQEWQADQVWEKNNSLPIEIEPTPAPTPPSTSASGDVNSVFKSRSTPQKHGKNGRIVLTVAPVVQAEEAGHKLVGVEGIELRNLTGGNGNGVDKKKD
jgi:hypothetical protein